MLLTRRGLETSRSCFHMMLPFVPQPRRSSPVDTPLLRSKRQAHSSCHESKRAKTHEKDTSIAVGSAPIRIEPILLPTVLISTFKPEVSPLSSGGRSLMVVESTTELTHMDIAYNYRIIENQHLCITTRLLGLRFAEQAQVAIALLMNRRSRQSTRNLPVQFWAPISCRTTGRKLLLIYVQQWRRLTGLRQLMSPSESARSRYDSIEDARV